MKKSNESNTSGGGVGFVSLLALAFIVLKLIGVIDWPWLWVLSPIWIPALIVFAILVIYGIVLWKIKK